MDPKQDPVLQAKEYEASADQFREQLEAAAREAAALREFFKVWMPVGLAHGHLVKRRRFRTKPHSLRKTERRRKNKEARKSRKRNRR